MWCFFFYESNEWTIFFLTILTFARLVIKYSVNHSIEILVNFSQKVRLSFYVNCFLMFCIHFLRESFEWWIFFLCFIIYNFVKLVIICFSNDSTNLVLNLSLEKTFSIEKKSFSLHKEYLSFNEIRFLVISNPMVKISSKILKKKRNFREITLEIWLVNQNTLHFLACIDFFNPTSTWWEII